MPKGQRGRSSARDEHPTTSRFDDEDDDYDTSTVRRRWNLDSNGRYDDDGSDYDAPRVTYTNAPPRGPIQNFVAIVKGLWSVFKFGLWIVRWIVEKTGYWLLFLIAGPIIGPILAWKKTYGRGKRTYHAARYAQEQGYLEEFWPTALYVAKKAVVIVTQLLSGGKVDLNDTLLNENERANGSVRSSQRPRRSQRNGRSSPTYSQSPTLRMDDEESDDDEAEEEEYQRKRHDDETASISSLMFTPVTKTWFILSDLFFLAVYALFGWTFGRYDVNESGGITKRRGGRGGSRRSAAGSSWRNEDASIGGSNDHRYNLRSRESPAKRASAGRRSAAGSGSEGEEGTSWLTWVLLGVLTTGFLYTVYYRQQETPRHH
ncbi:hypothetical protein M3Y99_01775700 [Aphelenchoides fujianensis]|nr:hypothetical protein M3Y99_01775700 [Aphelenchoides fujianensis]